MNISCTKEKGMENYIAAFTGKTLLATKLIASTSHKHCDTGGVY